MVCDLVKLRINLKFRLVLSHRCLNSPVTWLIQTAMVCITLKYERQSVLNNFEYVRIVKLFETYVSPLARASHVTLSVKCKYGYFPRIQL